MARPAGHLLSRTAWDDLLRLAGLDLTTVADMAGVPRSTVSSLLGGHHRASVPTAHKIAKAIPCHPATLFPTLSGQAVEAA